MMEQFVRRDIPNARPIQAIQIRQDTIAEASMLTHGHVVVEIDPETDERTVGINVATVAGVQRASTNDWVLRDSAGALHVMGQVEFNLRYETLLDANKRVEKKTHTDVREMRAQQREARDG